MTFYTYGFKRLWNFHIVQFDLELIDREINISILTVNISIVTVTCIYYIYSNHTQDPDLNFPHKNTISVFQNLVSAI